MKKLLAVLVVLALVSSAVFAEVGVGVGVDSGVVLLSSDGVKDSDLATGMNNNGWSISASGQSDDNVIGGKLVHDSHWFVWWQPISQFKLNLGKAGWGEWGTGKDAIVGWGFNAGAQDKGVAINDYGIGNSYSGYEATMKASEKLSKAKDDAQEAFDNYTNNNNADDPITKQLKKALEDAEKAYDEYGKDGYNNMGAGTGFYGGGPAGMLLQLFPVDGLTLNISLPFYDNKKFEDTFLKLHAQLVYDIAGIGTVNFAYAGSAYKNTNAANGEATGKFFLSFNMSAIENVGLNVGVAYQLPKTAYGDDKDVTNYPMEIGLGASYAAGAFGVRARFATKLGGSWVYDGDK